MDALVRRGRVKVDGAVVKSPKTKLPVDCVIEVMYGKSGRVLGPGFWFWLWLHNSSAMQRRGQACWGQFVSARGLQCQRGEHLCFDSVCYSVADLGES